jgi:hypothetical protein
VCPLLIIYKDRERIDDVIDPVGIWIASFLPPLVHRGKAGENNGFIMGRFRKESKNMTIKTNICEKIRGPDYPLAKTPDAPLYTGPKLRCPPVESLLSFRAHPA